jgi:hypothetical protein
MATLFRGLAAVIAAVSVIGFANAVLADAIDGDWCDGKGKSFTIRGPKIVTPGGKEIAGRYDRHGFDYVVPAGEPGAGGDVHMILLNDQTVRLRPPGAGEDQIWKRCSLKTS